MEGLTESKKESLRIRQTELIKILEALSKLGQSEEWNVLKELIFDKSLASIERQMLNYSKEPKINTDKLYKLQGEWDWAKRYFDIERFAESLKKELEEINKILK